MSREKAQKAQTFSIEHLMWKFLCAFCVFSRLTLPALAHNPDTSYARIGISSNQLSFRLTYDLFTLLKIARLNDNGDRQISREELERHAPEIFDFLRQAVAIEINGHEGSLGAPAGFVWPPDAGAAIHEQDFHSAAALVHFRFTQPLDDTPENVAITFNFFGDFGERHSVLGVFEFGGKEEEVLFSRFEPDFDYYTGYETPLPKRLWKFLKLGVGHIFLGYDHICFLVALIVVSRFRELVKIVTAFTVAHSITLILAALEWVTLPTRLVESGIALTIVYVALENLWVKDTRHRWLLTFGFGLIHGFGFANVLRETGLPTTGLVRCLLSFNVGVELGQLAIVLALLPLALWLGKWRHGRKVVVALSLVLALFGAAWFVERAFALGFMPF
ncbi:MAG: HupE/UreJ family protein [Verrucomicrobia bacterium]|nr:HupE/UreJ family protein [Verrucomicrobiota bacterium]